MKLVRISNGKTIQPGEVLEDVTGFEVKFIGLVPKTSPYHASLIVCEVSGVSRLCLPRTYGARLIED